jgi:hypothetical protein
MNDDGPDDGPKLDGSPSEPVVADRRDVPVPSTAKNRARRALRVLLRSAAERRAYPAGNDKRVDAQEFDAMTLCSDDYIVAIDRAESGDPEHRLFVAATEGLTDEEYLACIDVSSAAMGSADTA